MHACMPVPAMDRPLASALQARAAPDVCCYALVWVVHQPACLQLVERAVRKVFPQQLGSHPLSPLQRQQRLNDMVQCGGGRNGQRR